VQQVGFICKCIRDFGAGPRDRGFESYRGLRYLSVVSVMCCQVVVSATSWSLVQRSLTICGASLCVIKKTSRMRRSWPALGRSAKEKKLYIIRNMNVLIITGRISRNAIHYTDQGVAVWVSSNVSVNTSTHKSVTPCSRNLPEKPTVPQLVKKLPAFYRSQSSITAFKRARHLSLSWAPP
jgi:hypothetical protein